MKYLELWRAPGLHGNIGLAGTTEHIRLLTIMEQGGRGDMVDSATTITEQGGRADMVDSIIRTLVLCANASWWVGLASQLTNGVT